MYGYNYRWECSTFWFKAPPNIGIKLRRCVRWRGKTMVYYRSV